MTDLPLSTILDSLLRDAGVPIDGVSVGKRADPATWAVVFNAAATPDQRALALTLIREFDPDAPVVKEDTDARAANGLADSRQIRAFWLFQYRATHGGKDPSVEDHATARAMLVQAYLDTPEEAS